MKLSSPQSRAAARELTLAFWLGLAALIIALICRTTQLDLRPMHVDETTQAMKLDWLQKGRYEYDPKEHHGPTQLYIAAMVKGLCGVDNFNDLTENHLRAVAVIGGMLLVLLIPLLSDGLGKLPTAWAMVLTALSPILVFYSRYFIMEIWLAVFSLATIAFGWRFYRTRSFPWLVACGASLGLMHATKETFVIHAAAMVAGMIAVYFSNFMSGGLTVDRSRLERIGKRHLTALLGVAIFVSVICFTQGFTRMHAAWDSIATYGNYIGGRSEGEGHQKPWYYYILLLMGNKGGNFWAAGSAEAGMDSGGKFIWTEIAIYLFALLGVVRLFGGRGRGYDKSLILFLAVYAFSQFVVYSIVAYKTPWCIISAHHGFILLAAFGLCSVFTDLVQSWIRWLAGAIAVGVLCHLALQTNRANYKDVPEGAQWLRTGNYYARTENPYAYGFTPTGVLDLVTSIGDIAARHPEGKAGLHIAICSPGGGWPLPWYLRHFGHVEYAKTVGLDTVADVLLIDPAYTEQLPVYIRGGDETATHIRRLRTRVSQQFWLEGYVRKDLVPADVKPN